MRSDRYSRLSPTTDPQTDARAWSDAMDLAEQFRLTLYDAAYLELAQRRALSFATLDADLRAAGEALGVALLGE
jgi:predicted nucleic acid-binding protein